MEFNVLNNIDVIKENIQSVIARRKNIVPQKPPLILQDPPKRNIENVDVEE